MKASDRLIPGAHNTGPGYYADDGRHDALLREAEGKIQRILLDLEEAAGKRVDQVNVDTRNFANCLVEIFLNR